MSFNLCELCESDGDQLGLYTVSHELNIASYCLRCFGIIATFHLQNLKKHMGEDYASYLETVNSVLQNRAVASVKPKKKKAVKKKTRKT